MRHALWLAGRVWRHASPHLATPTPVSLSQVCWGAGVVGVTCVTSVPSKMSMTIRCKTGKDAWDWVNQTSDLTGLVFRSNVYQFSSMKKPGYKTNKERWGRVWCNEGEYSMAGSDALGFSAKDELCRKASIDNVRLEAVFIVAWGGCVTNVSKFRCFVYQENNLRCPHTHTHVYTVCDESGVCGRPKSVCVSKQV